MRSRVISYASSASVLVLVLMMFKASYEVMRGNRRNHRGARDSLGFDVRTMFAEKKQCAELDFKDLMAFAEVGTKDALGCLDGLRKIFELEVKRGQLAVSEDFAEVVKGWLGQSDELYRQFRNQSVVHVFNRFTQTTTVYNPLRASRPLPKTEQDPLDYVRSISGASAKSQCQFCRADRLTAKDAFGRLELPMAMTAANAFKLSDHHALIITRDHDPLALTLETFQQMFQLARNWFELVHATSPGHAYPMLIFDSLPHAGVSQIHPHMHALLGEDHYLGQYRQFHLASGVYQRKRSSFYFQDLIQAHLNIGLAVKVGRAVVLCPLDSHKDHEFLILSDEAGPDWVRAFHAVFLTLTFELKVPCYSSASAWPVIGQGVARAKTGLPALARIGGRGNCQSMMSDVSSLELYFVFNVNTNPYRTIQALERTIRKHKL